MVQYQIYTPNFHVTYQGQKVVQVEPHFGVYGQMIDIILLVSFSGSNPDIWFKHELEPFDTIRPRYMTQVHLTIDGILIIAILSDATM